MRLKVWKKCLGCAQKVVCFEDEEEQFDDEENLPTCKQVLCWKLIRSRKNARQFHTSVETLEALEKSKQ